MKVARLYRFRARHSLPGVEGYDKPHPHNYTVEVVVGTNGYFPDLPTSGMIVDTQLLDDWFARGYGDLDGADLNVRFKPSTVEVIAGAIRWDLNNFLEDHDDVRVTVWEDDDRWGQAP